ncbi:GNAT family N-acetyltransferase [Streptomyces sp. MP131-18]|uniref:GNAT family N-acetyltransferase n=1 Tax=Streptomyces sp. MP131-18 TaxID=1857892 RepID=UPI00097C2315|nr:GNAT family N-acetyltransferase [Streptomyces sp. MP131-18]ONK13186.1 putative acetyltransferase [Streptomyces sp. MP131-18]
MPQLTVPVVNVCRSYLRAIEEYQREGGYPDFDDLDVGEPKAFADYVARLRDDPRRKVEPWMAPMTLLWWVEGAEYLGRVSIWHWLAGPLAEAGHIGYDVRPSARGRGLATPMLAAALPHATRLGIDPALVTPRVTNVASRRVIENNGGQLVEEREGRLYFHLPTAGGS